MEETNERLERLLKLKELIETQSDNFSAWIAVEKYFFGDTISGNCKCKQHSVKSRLDTFWSQPGGGKEELDILLS